MFAAWVIVSLCGCSMFGSGESRMATLLNRTRFDEISAEDVMGPEERRLRAAAKEDLLRNRAELASTELEADFRELEAAQQLFDAGQYPQAEEAFNEIAKRYKTRTSRSLGSRLLRRNEPVDNMLKESPIEEDALFMVAESQFKQGRLADAQKSYSYLLKMYPSTRHLDATARQLFRISREWLGFPDAEDQEIVQVAYTESAAPTLEQRKRPRRGFNFRDKSRPFMDVEGQALAGLRLIWLHDAAGPLADDALMMVANHYLRKGDYVQAAQHYQLLREQFPDSPHMRDALLLGSHVTLASYNGPGYDPSPLEEAKELKLLALQFPDLAPEERKRLEEEIQKIQEAEIEPLWKEIEFYLTKRQPEAVELHCNYLINKHPNSKYAKMAWNVLEDLRNKGQLPPRPQRRGPAEDDSPAQPLDENSSGDSSRGSISGLDLTPPEVITAPRTEKTKRRFGRFLRRTEKEPDLQTPPDEPNESKQQPPGRVRLQSY